jgi:peptidyl-prolyl cis-trans isomerase D
MLQFMRQRASSWIIKGILSIIVLAFIFMGVGNFRNQNNVTAATVNGDDISVTQFQDRYYTLMDSARQQFGNQLNDEILKMLNLKERALDQLITETLLLQKAAEIGFQVSDRELSDTIRNMAVFQRDGRFSPDLYNAILKRNRLTPEGFEQLQKREMLIQKVKQLIDDSVKISDDEARSWFDWQQAEIKIKVAVFKPRDFLDVNPSEDALKKYFDEHKEKYRTQEKTQITYIRFDPEEFTAQVTVNEDEVRQYYEDHISDYSTEKTVEASHVLIKVDENAPEATVSAKEAEAMKIYEMVTSGGKDFAAVAKEYSEDSGSAYKGGSLGKLKKNEVVAPFAEKVFSMEPGEISRPLRTRFGWHVIKVDKVNEASVTPLSEAAADIKKKLALEKARNLAYQEALSVFDTAIDKDSVEKAAEASNRKAETTPLFTRTDSLEGIPESGDLIRQAFDLLDNEISDVFETGGSYYLFQVVQRVAPDVPALASVREQVLKDLSAQMREEAARKAAEDFLETLEDGKTMEDAAENTSAELITSDFFKRQAPIPGIGNEPELSRESFLLSPEKRLADKVIDGSKGYYVVYLEDRRSPSAESFAAEKDNVRAQLMQLKKQDAFSAWLSAMKAESKIKRNERILN